mgnify:FL=1
MLGLGIVTELTVFFVGSNVNKVYIDFWVLVSTSVYLGYCIILVLILAALFMN